MFVVALSKGSTAWRFSVSLQKVDVPATSFISTPDAPKSKSKPTTPKTRNTGPRLSTIQRQAIVASYARGNITQPQLAKRYGCTVGHVNALINGRAPIIVGKQA